MPSKVRIVEVVETDGKFSPSGRSILMDADCPLFETFQPRDGVLAVPPTLFNDVWKIVKEAQDEAGTGPEVSGGAGQ